MTLTQQEQDEAVALLQRLVRAASISGNEKAAAEVVAGQMRSMDFDRVWVDELGNVIGERRGNLPGPSLIFDGHMDVVEPGKVDEWTDDPFSGALKDGKIHGRGSTDTKSSLAGIVMALGSLPRSSIRGTLYAVGAVGEEVLEGVGLRPVIEDIKPDGVVIGEPTDCKLAIGQKGRVRFLFTAHGRSAHSSTPDLGDNAVLKAGEILRRVESLPLPETQGLGKGVMVPLTISSKPGGVIMSTIPYECQILYDRRLVADETVEGMLAEYRAALSDLPGWDVSVDMVRFDAYTGKTLNLPDFHPAWQMDENTMWVKSAVSALRQVCIEPDIHRVPYCTDGSVPAGEFGLPTVIFGPSSIPLAHIVNEYVLVEEYLRGIEGYRALAAALPDAFLPL